MENVEFNKIQETLRAKYEELYRKRTGKRNIPKYTIIYELGENDPYFIDNVDDCIGYNITNGNLYETDATIRLTRMLSRLYLSYMVFFDKSGRLVMIDGEMVKKTHFDMLNNVTIKTSKRAQAVLIDDKVFEALSDVLYLGDDKDTEYQTECVKNVIEDILVKRLKCKRDDNIKKLSNYVLFYTEDSIYDTINDTVDNVKVYGIDKVLLEIAVVNK